MVVDKEVEAKGSEEMVGLEGMVARVVATAARLVELEAEMAALRAVPARRQPPWPTPQLCLQRGAGAHTSKRRLEPAYALLRAQGAHL